MMNRQKKTNEEEESPGKIEKNISIEEEKEKVDNTTIVEIDANSQETVQIEFLSINKFNILSERTDIRENPLIKKLIDTNIATREYKAVST